MVETGASTKVNVSTHNAKERSRSMNNYEARRLLGLPKHSDALDPKQLKRKFKELSFKYHPDRCKDASVDANHMFSQIFKAHKFLKRKLKVPTPCKQSTASSTHKARTTTKTKACAKQKTSAAAATGEATPSPPIPNASDVLRIADEQLMTLACALKQLGIEERVSISDGGATLGEVSGLQELIDAKYKRQVLLSWRTKGNGERPTTRLLSTAYDRVMLAINFERHWSSAYLDASSSDCYRAQQIAREDGIIEEHARRQAFLERSVSSTRGPSTANGEGSARVGAERMCTDEIVKGNGPCASVIAKRAMAIAKDCAVGYSISHGVLYQMQLTQQRDMQIAQQRVALRQHIVDAEKCSRDAYGLIASAKKRPKINNNNNNTNSLVN